MKPPLPPARKAYPSNLRKPEWVLLEPLVPAVNSGACPAQRHRRKFVNAMPCIVRGGNQVLSLAGVESGI